MRRILQLSAITLGAALAAYCIAFFGFPAVVQQVLQESTFLQSGASGISRHWLPMPVIGS